MSIEWLAGFFDGEGCVQLEVQKRNGYRYWYPRLQLTQKDIGILRHIQAQFGGSLHVRNAGKGCSAINWCGEQAVALAKLLLPASLCKRDQLLTLIEAMYVPSRDREDWHDLITVLKQNVA